MSDLGRVRNADGRQALRVLTVDTATRRATVAAVLGDCVLHRAEHEQQRTHAEQIAQMMDEVLARAGWEREVVELLAVGQGPGSFTGVRVGMAMAKGFGFALGIPLVGVISLQAMAQAARAHLGAVPVAAMLDAKKGEVFLASYDGVGVLMGAPSHLARPQVVSWLDEQARVLGAGLRVVGEVVSELDLGRIAGFRHPSTDLPDPLAMATLAAARWQSQGLDELEHVEPLYVRPPDIKLPTSNSTPTQSKE